MVLEIGDRVPAPGGEIEIISNNGSGLFYGNRFWYDGDGNIENTEPDHPYTAEDLEYYYKDATGHTIRYASYIETDDEVEEE